MRTLPRAMPALLTPFTRTGTVDVAAHRANVARMREAGMGGILIAGSTGEGPYLEDGERRLLVETARAVSPGAFILCGIHSETLRGATAGLREAADGGADAALVVTPTTLVRSRHDLIEAFYRDVVAAAPLPVLLYSVPKVTALELSEQAAGALARLPGIVGIKDSGGDPIRAGRLAQLGGDFTVYTGATAAVTLAVTAGAHGAITASANYAPRLVIDTVTAARRSARTAAPLQARLSAVAGAIERHGIPAVKYAASRTGLVAGLPRRPLLPPSPEQRASIRRALRSAELA